MRRWLLSLVLCAVPAVAQEDPAALMPADAMVYAEVDAAALEKGLPELGLVKLLTDPRLRAFFQPTFDQLALDPEQPVASLLEKLPVRQWLAGKAAVGISGMVFRFKPTEGKETVIRISRDQPFDARMAHAIAGLALRTEWDADFDAEEVEFGADLLAVVEPGPALNAVVLNFLANPPLPVTRTKVKIGEREVDRIVASFFGSTVEIYADLGEKRWLVATTRELLAEALAGGPRASLAAAPSHRSVRARMTAGHSLAFGYVDFQPLVKIASKLIPPIVAESSEITGLASLRGLGFGISLTEGGVRESIGVVLDGDPKGAWKLLDAFPGGLHALEWAPPGALAAFGMKFDAQLLMQRWREVAAEVVPGNEGLLEHALDDAFREIGWDFKQWVLPALGDEIGVLVFPPAMGGMIPDLVVGVDFSNEEVFRKLLERIKTLVAAGVGVRFEPIQVTETIGGFQVFAPLPMQLTFAVAKGHLFGASSPQLLKKVLTEWGAEGTPCLLKDGPVFGQTLRGLNGGSNKNLMAFGYLNLRAALPQAYTMLPMMLGGAQLPKEWVDVTKVPDLQRMSSHVSGAAVGLRRDGDGITLDAFSPAGLLIPATAYTIYEEVRRQQRWARQVVVAEAPAQPQPAGKASLGINVMSSDGSGVTVLGFFEDSAAKKGGLKANDKIIAINEVPIKTIEDLRREVAKYTVGTEVKVKTTWGMFTIKLGRMVGR
ncbi:MAG: PDZ domain-containing protein [Planctomycetota bacterium]|jgi:hypothetical protein